MAENDIAFFERLRDSIRTLGEDMKVLMEGELAIEELDEAVKRMPRGKSSGIDGLTVEFYSFYSNFFYSFILL